MYRSYWEFEDKLDIVGVDGADGGLTYDGCCQTGDTLKAWVHASDEHVYERMQSQLKRQIPKEREMMSPDIFSSPMLLEQMKRQERESEEEEPVSESGQRGAGVSRIPSAFTASVMKKSMKKKPMVVHVNGKEIDAVVVETPCVTVGKTANDQGRGSSAEREYESSGRERKQSKIPTPPASYVSSSSSRKAQEEMALRKALGKGGDDPAPRRTEEMSRGTTTTIHDVPEGFSETYTNPLAIDEDNNCEESVNVVEIHDDGIVEIDVGQVTRGGQQENTHRMVNTPEALELLKKMAARDIKGHRDSSSNNAIADASKDGILREYDCYLRTGPQKLSPEPSKEYDIAVPKPAPLRRTGQASTDISNQGGEQCCSDTNIVDEKEEERVGYLLKTKGSGIGNRNDDSSATDEEDADIKHRGKTDESGDENHVSEDEHLNDNHQGVQACGTLELVSPVFRDGEAGRHGGDEVPATLSHFSAHRKATRVISPIAFNLSPSSAEAAEKKQDGHGRLKVVTSADVSCAQAKDTSSSSFSFGMGEILENALPESTAQIVEMEQTKDPKSGGEDSVDQPNPFVSVLGHLRYGGPNALQSPLGGGKVKHAVLSTPEDECCQNTDIKEQSPESPIQVTPLNMISADSGGSKSKKATSPQTPLLGAGEIDIWIEHRGLKSAISSPAVADLKRMWNAIRDVSSTKEAYKRVTSLNEQLKEELEIVRAAEQNAREALEAGNSWATAEIKKSEDAALQMMALADEIQKAFSLCEKEKIELSEELETVKGELQKAWAQTDTSEKGIQLQLETVDGNSKLLDANTTCDIIEQQKESEDFRMVSSKVKYFESLVDKGNASMSKENRAIASRDEGYIQITPGPHGNTPILEATQTSSPLLGVPETVTPLLVAPHTTPVTIDANTRDANMLSKVMPCGGLHHQNTIMAVRDLIRNAHSSASDTEESEYEEMTPREEYSYESTSSDEEELGRQLSPLDLEELQQGSRSNLRNEVKSRLFRLKNELENAKLRLNHVEHGLLMTQVSPGVSYQQHEQTKQSNILPAMSPCPSFIPATESPFSVSPQIYSPYEKENEHKHCDSSCHDATPSQQDEYFCPVLVDRGNIQEDTTDAKPLTPVPIYSEDQEENLALPVPSVMRSTTSSARSMLARRLGTVDDLRAPFNKRDSPFHPTPQTRISTARFHGKGSPGISTGSMSSSSPLIAVESTPRLPRRRRAQDRRPTASDEKEFRRRAAALKIHVSPYFRRNKKASIVNTDIDTVL